MFSFLHMKETQANDCADLISYYMKQHQVNAHGHLFFGACSGADLDMVRSRLAERNIHIDIERVFGLAIRATKTDTFAHE